MEEEKPRVFNILYFSMLLCLIARSLQEFAGVLQNLEDERTRMVGLMQSSNRSQSLHHHHRQAHGELTALVSPQIDNASDVLITPLERFRKEQIGAAKVRNLLVHC